jgi:hypothetical protein
MKTTILMAAVMLAGLLAAGPAQAQVSEDEFRKMQQQMKELQKQREQDRQEIQRLNDKIGATEKKATETEKKVEETSKTAAEAQATAQSAYTRPSEEASARSHFQMTGYAHAGYQMTEGENGSFVLGSFNPIFLYRAGDNLLFEGELEVEVENGRKGGGTETDIGLEYAQMDYAFNDYVTGIAGKMLLPLGSFIEKSHPAWINKLPNFPLPRQDETAILPESGVGVQMRGAFHPCADHILNYSLYGVNGPSSMDGSGMADQLDLGAGVEDMNNAPSAGGRVGWLYPWKPYQDIELGVSGQSGYWDEASDLLWSACVVDAALHLGPNFEARGEYINTWQETTDRGTVNPRGWWAQAAYKLAGLNLDWPVVNNLESVFRYSTIESDLADSRTQGYALGLIYYLSNQFQLKGAYEFITSTDEQEANNRLLLQVAYGF